MECNQALHLLTKVLFLPSIKKTWCLDHIQWANRRMEEEAIAHTWIGGLRNTQPRRDCQLLIIIKCIRDLSLISRELILIWVWILINLPNLCLSPWKLIHLENKHLNKWLAFKRFLKGLPPQLLLHPLHQDRLELRLLLKEHSQRKKKEREECLH